MRDGWRESPLLDLVHLQNGYPFKPADLGADGLPVIRIKELMNPSVPMDRSAVAVPESVHINTGDVIFSWSGRLEAMRWLRGPAVLNQHLFRVTPRSSEVSSDFSLLLLQHLIPSLHLNGTTMRHVTKAELKRRTVNLPPLDEQRRIIDLVGALDDAIAAIDASMQRCSVVLDTVRDQLPDGPLLPVGEVLERIESGTSTKAVEGEGPRQKLLTLAAIRPGVFLPSEVKDVGPAGLREKALLKDGDLLITRSNTPERVGYAAIAHDVESDTYLPDLVWRLVPREQRVSRAYLAEVLSSATMRRAITGAASGTSQSMRKINKANFSQLSLPVPSREAQVSYVGPLAALGAAIANHRAAGNQLRDLRTNLLTALLSGAHEIPESYDELVEGTG